MSGKVIFVNQLLRIRQKALRRKAWFTVLEKEERMIINLAIRCVKRIRSLLLGRMIKRILNKLVNAMKSETVKFVESVGPSLAQKVSDIAVSWGNARAKTWASDRKFARHLAIMKLNVPRIFRV